MSRKLQSRKSRRWALAAVGLLVAVGFTARSLHVVPVGLWPGSGGGVATAVADTSGAAHGTVYTCPMHPQIRQDRPGDCPLCGMHLTPVGADGDTVRTGDVPAEVPPAPAPPAKTRVTDDGKQLWTCGMHPQVIQEEPGTCPICGMNLVPLRTDVGNEGEAVGAGGGERKILFYRNPMDPTITSPVPRKDEMGMDYVPVYSDEAEGVAKQGATVTIDPTMIQNMNVTTEPVKRQDVRREIRTVGYLDYDQEKIVSVTTKFQGFIESVHANYVGQQVHKGDPLFEIYAPALVQTEQELLSARAYADRMQDAPAEVAERARALHRAARERLGLWDISAAQIDHLERTGEVQRTLTVVAPASGMIRTRMEGLEGMATRPGMDLLSIADLSTLWLVVEVYENQMPWVDVGGTATVTLDYFPGEKITGKVRYVEPHIAEKTRSLRLTLAIPNPTGRLRAGMYATVRFEPVVAADAITVPSQAVLRTGERDVVIVALGKGRFAPRDVVLGPEGDGFVQVLRGLVDGDEVVTSSQFLIDSESNLRAAIMKMIAEKQH